MRIGLARAGIWVIAFAGLLPLFVWAVRRWDANHDLTAGGWLALIIAAIVLIGGCTVDRVSGY